MSWQLEEENICSLGIFSVKELLNISRSAGCLWELRLRIVIINKAKLRSFEARVQQIFKWWICKFFIQIQLFSVRLYHFVSHLFKLNNKLQRFEGEIQSCYLKFVAYILSNGSMSYERYFRVICPLLVDKMPVYRFGNSTQKLLLWCQMWNESIVASPVMRHMYSTYKLF